MSNRSLSTDIGVGLTGAAGPDPHDGKPVGTVWIGIALQNEDPETYKLFLSGSRNANRLTGSKICTLLSH